MAPLLRDQRRLIELLATGLTRTEACRRVGMSRGTFYYWLHRSPAFRAAVFEAAERAGPPSGRSGVQLCRSCGQILSAQAAFFRRCGAFQSELYPQPVEDSSAQEEASSAFIFVPEWAGILLLTVSISALLTYLFVLPGA